MPTRQELERQVLEKRVMAKRQAAAEAEATRGAEAKFEADKPSPLESAGLGLVQGVGRNFGDEAIARASGGNYEDQKLRIQDRMRQAQTENPKAYGTGELTGSIGSAFLAPAPASVVGAAALAGGEGALSSLGRAQNLDANAVTNAAITGGADAALGGASAKVLPKLADKAGEVGSPLIDKIRDWVKARSGQQAVKALQPTQKQYERLATTGKLPAVGEMMLDEGVVTPFASSKTMAQRVQDLNEANAEATRPIYEQSKNSNLTTGKLLGTIDDKIAELRPDPGKAPIAGKLEGYKKSIEEAGRPMYNPSDLRRFRQDVDATVNWNSDAASHLGAKEMRSLLRDQEMGQIEKVDPALRAQNEELFRKLHLGNLAEDIADRGEARRGVNNLLGLNTWQAGRNAADMSRNMVTTATGPIVAGAMALRELTNRYGNQMTAVGLNKLSKVISGSRLAGALDEAAKRGPQALAAAHAMALKNDPAYKSAFEDALNSNDDEVNEP